MSKFYFSASKKDTSHVRDMPHLHFEIVVKVEMMAKKRRHLSKVCLLYISDVCSTIVELRLMWFSFIHTKYLIEFPRAVFENSPLSF